ncbi:HNH endonuclease [Bifidobacterium aemilianum]
MDRNHPDPTHLHMARPAGTVNPRRSNGAARAKIKQRLIALSGGHPICPACGQAIDLSIKHPDPRSASIDEIVPISKGGSAFKLDNCRLMHLRCNESRGNRPLKQAKTATLTQSIPLSQPW